jgi:hypothetical protein
MTINLNMFDLFMENIILGSLNSTRSCCHGILEWQKKEKRTYLVIVISTKETSR